MAIPSCNRSKKDVSRIQDNQLFAGTWIANGPALLGYSHGKYTIQLDLASDGLCKMKFQYDLNKTAISDKFTDIVQLGGNWNTKDGKVKATMKVTNWLVTDLLEYRRSESFDSFDNEFFFKLVGEQLIPGEQYSSDMKFGTTKDARDMTKMAAEGNGIRLCNVKFNKNK
jgi:hypothetical protein